MNNKFNKACPFCGSHDLVSNQWAIVADEEVAAIECNQCKAGAPLSIWNIRATEATEATEDDSQLELTLEKVA